MRSRGLLFPSFALALFTSVAGCSSSSSNDAPEPSTPLGSHDPGASAPPVPVADDAAHPVHVVASDARVPVYAVAVDGDHVYFTTDTAVMSAPLAGGAAAQIAAAAPSTSPALGFDAQSIFWSDRGEGGDASAIRLAGKAGGAAAILGATHAEASAPRAIAVDATNVYYTTADGAVVQVPKAGGAEHTLATGQSQPATLAVDEEAVYWTTSDGALRKTAIGDTIVNNLASVGGPIGGITVDDTCVFFSDTNAGAIKMVWKDGSHPQAIADKLTAPGAVVEDKASKAVYFLVEGALMKASDDGGPATRIAHAIDGATGLAVVQGQGVVVWGSKTGVYATTSP